MIQTLSLKQSPPHHSVTTYTLNAFRLRLMLLERVPELVRVLVRVVVGLLLRERAGLLLAEATGSLERLDAGVGAPVRVGVLFSESRGGV